MIKKSVTDGIFCYRGSHFKNLHIYLVVQMIQIRHKRCDLVEKVAAILRWFIARVSLILIISGTEVVYLVPRTGMRTASFPFATARAAPRSDVIRWRHRVVWGMRCAVKNRTDASFAVRCAILQKNYKCVIAIQSHIVLCGGVDLWCISDSNTVDMTYFTEHVTKLGIYVSSRVLFRSSHVHLRRCSSHFMGTSVVPDNK